MRGVLFGFLLSVSALAQAQSPQPTSLPGPPPPSPAAAPDYTQDSAWLCLPGRADPCGAPLPTADLNPEGFGPVTLATPAANPPLDCFYVYPTISRDPGLNSDLETSQAEERGAAFVQAARFSSVCRMFAPVYRSVTLAGLAPTVTANQLGPPFALAYGDVLAAWRNFLATRNDRRPFVLIGHSQGSIHLLKLLQDEIEGRPIARQMVSALLIGWRVDVPPGRDVGGALRSTPLCRRAGQTGCVVTYMSFRADVPPPEGSLFGRAERPGMTAGCTNPAALAGGAAGLESYWFAGGQSQDGPNPVRWSSAGPPPAPFAHIRGLVTATCVNDGPLGYLRISTNADPADARTDRIPGDVILFGQPQPGWGLHPADMYLAQGDLIRLVAAQGAAFARGRR